ncbi:MAG: SUMF1/EgtB/PvdO family nonheme iron enzyme [Nitrospirales bacterium]
MSVICVFVFEPSAFAQNLNDLKAGVVKITTKTGQVGTGFIVRVEPEILYLITAAHVIAGDPEPEVEFFATRNMSVNGSVLPGAELNDDLRGLALVVVRGKVHIPDGVTALPFGKSVDLVSGGEEALVIGHPGGGGDWAILKRQISNRIGRDIALDPNVESRFSGGPIIVRHHVVGIVMSRREGFGLGITHKSVLNYLEGFSVVPSPSVNQQVEDDPRGFQADARKKESDSQLTLPETKTGKDGAPMVLVPAGEFTMGSLEGEGGSDEHPQHTVDLDAYYIDQYEVTVDRYQRFMKENNRSAPRYWDQVLLRRDAQKPVVGIDWQDAHDYCQWAGKRMPTEAEWEKAARRGTAKRTYPWGEFTPNSSTANFGKGWSDAFYADRLKNVGTYKQGESPYGAYDMAGNVMEWVADWYAEDYYQASPKKNPKGPLSGKRKVLRGGSWRTGPSTLRSADRDWNDPSGRHASIGVRCAQDAP